MTEQTPEQPKKTSTQEPQAMDDTNIAKDPEQWVTGEERMTGAQASYLKTLCEEAGEPFDPNLSKADASKRIDDLKRRTGRGT